MCGNPAPELIHKVIDGVAVTSDANYTKSLDPHLAYCNKCNFWFTRQGYPIENFYSGEYSLLMQDFLTDQNILVNGSSVKRAQYQASLVFRMLLGLGGENLLEVGAGKGLTAYHLKLMNGFKTISLHDPGEKRYKKIWEKYVEPNSTHTNLSELAGINFDLGFTFFTLEHTATPRNDMNFLLGCMPTNGVFFGIVPWLSLNPGDLLVADHCSHFSIISLTRFLESYKASFGIKYRLLINKPLRGLSYVCSKSEERLNLAILALMGGGAIDDFILAESIEEKSDQDIIKSALHYWRSKPDLISKKREVLWGAGFYSKLIMLQNKEKFFSVCIDSNYDLVGTAFKDQRGNDLIVCHSEEWLKQASSGDRIWLGVSDSAKQAILNTHGRRFKDSGIEVVF
jgi:hypothetical protein